MIEAKNLTKVYAGVTVLDIPEITVKPGETFGLVGNNGAGKTTFFSLILDLIQANTGTVFSHARDVRLSDHWKEYTGSFLDESFVIDFLSPEEYFEFIGGLFRKSKEETAALVEPYRDFFNDEILGKKKYIRDLSKGNQKKVGIVGALMMNPKVLVLDEPFPHLDPSSVIRLKKMLKSIGSTGDVTILISSHDLNHVTEVCNRIALLEKGKILRDTPTTERTIHELEAYFSAQLER